MRESELSVFIVNCLEYQGVYTMEGLYGAGLSLSAGCRRNCPAEKEVIAGWVLAGDHSVKNNERFLGYARTIV